MFERSGNYSIKTLFSIPAVVFYLFLFTVNSVKAQLQLPNTTAVVIDFTSTKAGVENGTFAAGGFNTAPAAGQLNSNGWAVNGWSDPSFTFGGTGAGGTDFGRGTVSAAQSTGGIYAYNNSGNVQMMMQPGGSDFTPGYITLKVQNTNASIMNQLAVSYKIYQRNDQLRSQSLTFSYSTDDVTYTPISGLDYATPGATDALGWVVGATKSTTITGINVPSTTFIYLRWSSDDISTGALGARDEIGLDDITLAASYPAACIPPTISAAISSFSAVSANQMTVNYTRGNGSGGLIAVASPAALTVNPITGIIYTANSNYGTGSALGNGYVVYNSGAASGSFTITGLTASTNYIINLFEYDVTGPCYQTTGVNANQTTAAGSAIPSAQFRSFTSGSWANATTWEYFNTGTSLWTPSDRIPNSSDLGILIQAPHTVDISSAASVAVATVAGTLTLSNGGVINLANGSGTDLSISTGGVLQVKATTNYTTTFVIAASATINVATGGKITIGNGASTPGYSPLASTASLVTWNDASIFEWNTTDPFLTSSATPPYTYFPGVATNVIPVFRITKSPSLQPGASTATLWNGLMEVNANVTLKLAGTKTFRNGIIGTAAITQDDACGQFIINGTTAKLGVATLNLNTTGVAGLDINSGSLTTMTSNVLVNTAGPTTGDFTVNGASSLYCDAFILSGNGRFTLNTGCGLRLGDPGGISGSGATGNIQMASTRSFNTGTNYTYNGIVNQITGNGMPTSIASLTINNTGAAGNKTVTLTTTNTTSPTLTLTNGLFASGTGQQLNISTGGSVIPTPTFGDFATGATAGIINFLGSGTFTNTCNPYNVYISGTGGVNFPTGTVTIQPNGSLVINVFSASSLVTHGTTPAGLYYGLNSSLIYNGIVGTFTVANEWLTNGIYPARGGPYNVIVQGSGTNVTFNTSGSPRYIGGNLNINASTTFSLSTASGGDLNIAGNWTRAASATFNNNARTVNFYGTSSDQTIQVTGGGTETFGYFKISKNITPFQNVILSGPTNPTNIIINGNLTASSATNTLVLTSGDIDLNGQTLTYNVWNGVSGSQNIIQVDGASTGGFVRNIKSTTGTGTFSFLNNSSGGSPNALIARNGSNTAKRLAFSSSVLVTIGISGSATSGGVDFGFDGAPTPAALDTINGTLQLNSGGFVRNNPPIYGTGSKLVYNSTGSYDRYFEWGNSQTQPGYPYNVIVQNNTTLRLNNGTNTPNYNRYLAGTLTISNGSTFVLNSSGSYIPNTLTVGADVVINGTLSLPGSAAPTAFGEDIHIGGNWTRSSTGVFDPGTPTQRAVYFEGSNSSTITAPPGGETFAYLRLTKSSNSLLLASDINITKELSITSGTFNLQNSNTTLKSDVNYTANLLAVTGVISYGGGSGTGRFIVERFIPTLAPPATSPYHTKKWEFLAVPVNNAGAAGGQTINAGWQEGQAPLVAGPSNKGTIITSDVASALSKGFDIATPAGPTMKTYATAPGNGSWVGVPTTTTTELYNQKGYMLFVRGDRTVTTYNGAATLTTMRSTGKVMEPANPPPSTAVPANQWESVGNPYACAINFDNVGRTGGVGRSFYVWDPKLTMGLGYGSYQSISWNSFSSSYDIAPGGGSYNTPGHEKIIESGQAFLVYAMTTGGTVTFDESVKSTSSNLLTRQQDNPRGIVRQIRNNLYMVNGNERVLIDGTLNQFNRDYSNNLDGMDVLKISNTGEDLGVLSGGKILSIERSGIIGLRDTIHYNLGRLSIRQYQFELAPENIARPGLNAFLVDKYLGTSTAISLNDTTRINFNVVNVPGSYAADRFMIVFRDRIRQVIYSLLTAETKEKEITVNWEASEIGPTGIFEVERSADGINFTRIHNEPGNQTGSYTWVDTRPFAGDNYYRIHNPDPADKNSYSNKVKITATGSEGTDAISVYPNPVKDGILNLKLKAVIAGDYLLTLYNNSGQQVMIKNFNYKGTAESEKVKLPAAVSKGIYKLEIIYPGGKRQSEQIFID